jgi:GNAT superfamily N-acetyltransferase
LLVKIRKALKADLKAILGLYEELEFGKSSSLDLNSAERIFERMERYHSYTLYLAELENEVVGTFALLIMDNLAHGGSPSGIVEEVVVHPHWQRRGIGKSMMHFAMGKCREAGCYKLTLSSHLKRKSAHKFYRSLGFRRHGLSFLMHLEEPSVLHPTTEVRKRENKH